MTRNRRLRELVAAPQILVAPSAYDGLSARVVQQAGFPALHMTGSGSHASVLGVPDLGFMGLSEMIVHAKNMALVVDIPIIADGDTGYGNALNVMRTIREFEQVGISGIHLEDQPLPKRCGHFDGKKIITTREMQGKIEAAAAARRDDDFMVIARTDAVATDGVEEAVRRGNAYAEAGADCIFVDAPRSLDDMKRARDGIKGPMLVNMAEGGKTPRLTTQELEAMGFNVVIYPLSGWMAAASAFRELLDDLKNTGSTRSFWERKGFTMTFEELFDLVGYNEARALEQRFVRS
jgi:carboxyvinyl-carboxyphosphonate phosphorylmutase